MTLILQSYKAKFGRCGRGLVGVCTRTVGKWTNKCGTWVTNAYLTCCLLRSTPQDVGVELFLPGFRNQRDTMRLKDTADSKWDDWWAVIFCPCPCRRKNGKASGTRTENLQLFIMFSPLCSVALIHRWNYFSNLICRYTFDDLQYGKQYKSVDIPAILHYCLFNICFSINIFSRRNHVWF